MLSIIIANFKNPPLLRLCLKSLYRTLSQESEYFSYEIVVTDSESSVETRNVVLEEFSVLFKRIKIVPFEKNIGYTRLVNEGIKNSQGEYFLVLNSDIVVLPNSLENMLAYLKFHPEIGLLGPQLLNFDDTIQQSWFRFPTPLTILYRRIEHLPFANKILNRFLMQDVKISTPLKVDWLMGSAIMTSRSAAQKVGLLDESLFLYMSEVDWARRFWENGYAVIYYPDAKLYHYHKRQSKGHFGILDAILYKETRWHILDAFRYFRKYGARAPLIHDEHTAQMAI